MSAAGGRILGSYRLIERIGKGGMGEVYRGVHVRLGSERAIKVLPANLAAEADFLKRFEREAASAARLDHPNILPVYDYGEEAGTPYLVMPYIRGGTLKDRMGDGPLPQAHLLLFLQQMGDALDYAHGQGLIHRDVKPANMLLDDHGRLYLADFGIAKALEGAEGLTRTGMGVGTPEYMAPEQAQGRADERSDLYAMGIILYQMLTGRVPFSGTSTVEVLMKHMQDPLPTLPLRNVTPALSPRVEQVLLKALAKNPNERYGSAQALVDDFREALAAGPGDPATVRDIALPPATTPPPGNTPMPDFGGHPTASRGVAQPPYGGGPMVSPAFATPSYSPASPGNLAGEPPAAPPRARNRGLLVGIAGGAAAVLLLCLVGVIGIAVVSNNSNNRRATRTAQAGAQRTAAVVAAANLAATQTAGAPTSTKPATATAIPTPTSIAIPTATLAPPTAVPTAVPPTTAPPTPTRVPPTTAPPTAAAPTKAPVSRQPLGPIPTGWKSYTGTAQMPVAIAYPPDWTLDTSKIANGQVYVRPPASINQNTWLLISTTGQPDPGANIDSLRDQIYKQSFDECRTKTQESTRNTVYAGITWASLGVYCDLPPLYLSRISAGLREQVPWYYRYNALDGEFNDILDQYIGPMLSTLNIYANP